MDMFNKDDGAIQPPDEPSKGAEFMRVLEGRAKLVYPDHGASREVFIREKVIEEINRLHDLLDASRLPVMDGPSPAT